MVINTNLPAQTATSGLNVNVDSEHDVFTINGVDLTAAVYATTQAADITTRAAC